jgi:hypothetical protein
VSFYPCYRIDIDCFSHVLLPPRQQSIF